MNQLKLIHKKVFEDNKKITAVVGMISIIIIISAVFSYEAGSIETKDASEVMASLLNIADLAAGNELLKDSIADISGTTNEGSATAKEFTIIEPVLARVTATLNWNDEDPGALFTNKPDEFSITLTSPSGESVTSEIASNEESGDLSGSVSVDLLLVITEDNSGDWECIVEAGTFGNIYFILGYVEYQEDDSNSWVLTIDYYYYDVE